MGRQLPRPRAEATTPFVRETGGAAVIGALTDARAMLAGTAGTRVARAAEPERPPDAAFPTSQFSSKSAWELRSRSAEPSIHPGCRCHRPLIRPDNYG